MLDKLRENPTMNLQEMVHYLFQSGYHCYTAEAISRALKSRGMSRINIEMHVMHLKGPEMENFLRHNIFINIIPTNAVSSIIHYIQQFHRGIWRTPMGLGIEKCARFCAQIS